MPATPEPMRNHGGLSASNVADIADRPDTCLARYDKKRKALVVLHEGKTYVFPVVPDSLKHLLGDLVDAAVRLDVVRTNADS